MIIYTVEPKSVQLQPGGEAEARLHLPFGFVGTADDKDSVNRFDALPLGFPDGTLDLR